MITTRYDKIQPLLVYNLTSSELTRSHSELMWFLLSGREFSPEGLVYESRTKSRASTS